MQRTEAEISVKAMTTVLLCGVLMAFHPRDWFRESLQPSSRMSSYRSSTRPFRAQPGGPKFKRSGPAADPGPHVVQQLCRGAAYRPPLDIDPPVGPSHLAHRDGAYQGPQRLDE